MLIFKALAFVWPFLKEMLLGDKSISEALRSAKGKLAVAVFVTASIVLNAFTIPRLVEISSDYISLRKKHEDVLKEVASLQEKVNQLVSTNPALQQTAKSEPALPPPQSGRKQTVSESQAFAIRRKYAKQAYEHMQQNETASR